MRGYIYMLKIDTILINRKEAKRTEHRTFRDELFFRLLEGWNKERESNGYSPITPRRLAVALKSNPFLSSDDGDLELLIKECEKKGSYRKAHWILFSKSK